MRRVFYIVTLLVVWMVSPISAQELKERLESLKGVEQVTALPAGEFKEKYEVMLRQPLDWKSPEAGSFLQRVIVMHTDFEQPTMLITQGYDAGFALRERYREEISRIFNTNMVFVEHRYFDKSMPESVDWQYLTAENSAYDLHAIKTLFMELYPSKWIASGISKGGTTTMLYATFFPGDVDIYVPYVGPHCTSVEDGRFERFFKEVGTPETREKIYNFQLTLLKNCTALLPSFDDFCKSQNLEFRVPLEEIFDYCVLEYAFTFWQWGMNPEVIPAEGADNQTIMKHLLEVVPPDYFSTQNSHSSFFVQAAKELGYYPYQTRQFKGLLSMKSTKDYLRKIFIPEELRRVKFDKTLYRKMKRYLKREDPKMMMIYGEWDPWTAPGAGWAVSKKKQNMKLYVDPEGSHRARILTLPEDMQQEAIETLRGWLE